MQIRMKHPKEGEKLVYLDDIPKHEQNGWVEVKEEAKPEPKSQPYGSWQEMQIRMKHPKEGEKLVYLDDIPKHEQNGWVEVKEEAKPEPKKRGRPAKAP